MVPRTEKSFFQIQPNKPSYSWSIIFSQLMTYSRLSGDITILISCNKWPRVTAISLSDSAQFRYHFNHVFSWYRAQSKRLLHSLPPQSHSVPWPWLLLPGFKLCRRRRQTVESGILRTGRWHRGSRRYEGRKGCLPSFRKVFRDNMVRNFSFSWFKELKIIYSFIELWQVMASLGLTKRRRNTSSRRAQQRSARYIFSSTQWKILIVYDISFKERRSAYLYHCIAPKKTNDKGPFFLTNIFL